MNALTNALELVAAAIIVCAIATQWLWAGGVALGLVLVLISWSITRSADERARTNVPRS